MTVLTTFSNEGWSITAYVLMDAMGLVVVVYFVLLVIIGSYFVVNLIAAVIYKAYVMEKEEVVLSTPQHDRFQRSDTAEKSFQQLPTTALVKNARGRNSFGRKICCWILTSQCFRRTVTSCIVENLTMLMAKHDN